ncbi:C1 family peptidase [Solidesulfovibrio magneticus]|uniref:Cysteine peptidase n=1 Tax=Solidesulfovibrio magneticus (strain ATCC 700980 / DSM 13731 / RS-1) TaxID=573370 RepID=C4XJD9_SOLM1|nr:C1 family peptidase [Solidesulfovibrio magneticus]BAH76689.1 putative cysteine peptidase [Solidesulfovibrio magneticus RS-1]
MHTFLLLTLMCLLITVDALAESSRVASINSEIAQKAKSSWKAGDNKFTGMSIEDLKKWATAAEEESVIQPQLSARHSLPDDVALEAPSRFTWTDVDGVNYVTSIKDQGSCGSCWAFAVTAQLETLLRIYNKRFDEASAMDLSEQGLLSCNNVSAGTCVSGYTSRAINFYRDVGAIEEVYAPYVESKLDCSLALQGTDSYGSPKKFKLKDGVLQVPWEYVGDQATYTVALVKKYLRDYGPLVVNMRTYYDFYFYESGVYHRTSAEYVGSHAILVVGYDDDERCFLVKNSWGGDWGEKGFFRISYDDHVSVDSTGTKFGGYAYYNTGVYGDLPSVVNPTISNNYISPVLRLLLD